MISEDMTDLEFELYMLANHSESFIYIAVWCAVEDVETGRNNGACVSCDAYGRYTKEKYGFNYYEERDKI